LVIPFFPGRTRAPNLGENLAGKNPRTKNHRTPGPQRVERPWVGITGPRKPFGFVKTGPKPKYRAVAANRQGPTPARPFGPFGSFRAGLKWPPGGKPKPNQVNLVFGRRGTFRKPPEQWCSTSSGPGPSHRTCPVR